MVPGAGIAPRVESSLRFLLRHEHETGKPAGQRFWLDYERDLEEIKQRPEYKKIAEGLDLVASHLEQVAEDIDLSELLQKLPKAKKSN